MLEQELPKPSKMPQPMLKKLVIESMKHLSKDYNRFVLSKIQNAACIF